MQPSRVANASLALNYFLPLLRGIALTVSQIVDLVEGMPKSNCRLEASSNVLTLKSTQKTSGLYLKATASGFGYIEMALAVT